MSLEQQPKADARRPEWAAFAIAAVLLVIAGVIFWDVGHLRGMGGYSGIGPSTVPDVIAAVLVVLAIWTVVAGIRHDFPEREKQEIGPVVWVIGGLAAQMLLLNTVGFSIATGALFAATAAGFGRPKLWISFPIGVALCLIVWLIFTQLLNLSLPAGPLEALFV